MSPDEVRQLRQRLGLTQAQFAELAGVHPVTVSRWETGALGLRPTSERLLRLLAAGAPEAAGGSREPQGGPHGGQ